jgi:hypothetical protein
VFNFPKENGAKQKVLVLDFARYAAHGSVT